MATANTEALIAAVGDPDAYDFQNCETRLDRFGPYNKHDVVAAILVSKGTFSQMAVLLGRNRSRVRDYVLARPDVKEIFDDIREGMLDQLEADTFHSAMAGDPTDRRFLLTTVGKNRGYSTRTEATGADNAPLIPVNMDKLKDAPTADLKSVVATLRKMIGAK